MQSVFSDHSEVKPETSNRKYVEVFTVFGNLITYF